MNRDLLDILACPICKGKLKLTVEKESNREIVSGTLTCPDCRTNYPIADTIPNLLPPDRRD